MSEDVTSSYPIPQSLPHRKEGPVTTSDEEIQLIAYLRDHRFIGEKCWADAGETERDHEGFECAVEILDYLSWEHDMRTAEAEWVGRT